MITQRDFLKGLALLLTVSAAPAQAAFSLFGQKGDHTAELGLTGGYLRLAPDYRSYGVLNSNAPANMFSSVLKVQPSNKFAGGADFTYGAALKLHFNYFATENRRGQSPVGGIIHSPLLPPGFSINNIKTAFSNLESQYRILSLSLRYPFSLSSFTLTPNLGISHLFLRHNHSTGYFGGTTGLSPTITNAGVDLNSKFKGYGPSFGALIEYGFCEFLSVFANLQYTPFIGNINARYRAEKSVEIPGSIGNYDYNYKTHSTVVTHAQTDVGFGWSKEIEKCYHINLRLGYRIIKIIGGREMNLLNNAAHNSAMDNQFSNSSLHGPFLRLGLKYKL